MLAIDLSRVYRLAKLVARLHYLLQRNPLHFRLFQVLNRLQFYRIRRLYLSFLLDLLIYMKRLVILRLNFRNTRKRSQLVVAEVFFHLGIFERIDDMLAFLKKLFYLTRFGWSYSWIALFVFFGNFSTQFCQVRVLDFISCGADVAGATDDEVFGRRVFSFLDEG